MSDNQLNVEKPHGLKSEEFSITATNEEESSGQDEEEQDETANEEEFEQTKSPELSEDESGMDGASSEVFLLQDMEQADAELAEFERQLADNMSTSDNYQGFGSQKSSRFDLEFEGFDDEYVNGDFLDVEYEQGQPGEGFAEQSEPAEDSMYTFSSDGPKSVESLYKLIEPDRENEFNQQLAMLNKQIANMQQEICQDRKERHIKKVKRFKFEKALIQNAVSEAGILYLPGNFLEPITGRRIDDKDLPDILEAMKELPESEFKGFNFAYNQITDEGISILAPFIQEKSHIIHLNFSHNDFTANGLHTLVTFLISRPSLQSLKLTGVKVGDEGINSITCLYMCGKGPRDLDVSETDMTTPGFQALCSALQAVDEDDDAPKFLTKYNLPFSLKTLARLKMENHEFLKSQTYHRLCHSQFELLPPRDKERRIDELNQELLEAAPKQYNYSKMTGLNQGQAEAMENSFITSILGGGDVLSGTIVDLNKEAEMSVEIREKAKNLPPVDEIIEVHKTQHEKGCHPSQPDGRPVIVCPNLYSLEVDEFEEDGDDASLGTGLQPLKKINPMYMDKLVEPSPELDTEGRQESGGKGKDVVDNLTAERTSVKFVRDVIKEAGTIAGVSDFTKESDRAQLLLMNILENAKLFLEAETEGNADDLTAQELKTIWEHSLETASKIFRPNVPAHCKIKDGAMDIFVEEFMKISCGAFYRLIQVPFFQDLFETAATKECIDSANLKAANALGNTPTEGMSYQECVRNVVLKFLEKVIISAAEYIGGGDPCNLRHPRQSLNEESPSFDKDWSSIISMNEEMVTPLVDQLFEVGGLLAQDAIACRQENERKQFEGIEPAKQYLEGIFKQLTNFLYMMKDDDKKLSERMEKPVKKFTFSTKPVRLVLNRPFFRGREEMMASKLATFLRGNDSVQCLHLRKWDLGEDGTLNLMSGLMNKETIVTLDLASNGIGTEGMHAIASFVRRNQNLKHLLLNHNRLRNPGLIALADALSESSLVSLNVAYNDGTDVGVNSLLEAIGKSNIYSLYILGNCFSQTSCTLISELFESKSLNQADCDVEIQDVDGEKYLAINAQARDLNEWYEVPVKVDLELICPPYYMEHYTPPKVSIFGAVDVEV